MTTRFLIKPRFCTVHHSAGGNMFYDYGKFLRIQASYEHDRVFVRLATQWVIYTLDDYYDIIKMANFLYD